VKRLREKPQKTRMETGTGSLHHGASCVGKKKLASIYGHEGVLDAGNLRCLLSDRIEVARKTQKGDAEKRPPFRPQAPGGPGKRIMRRDVRGRTSARHAAKRSGEGKSKVSPLSSE